MIHKLQKKALRLMNRKHNREHSKPLFEKGKILNVYSLYIYRLLELYIKNQNTFTDEKCKHYETRGNMKKIQSVPNARLSLSQSTPKFKVLKFLNSTNPFFKNFLTNVNEKNILQLVKQELLTIDVCEIKNVIFP